MTVSFLLMPGASVLERAWGLAMQTIGLIQGDDGTTPSLGVFGLYLSLDQSR
jgi:hypothetical protein